MASIAFFATEKPKLGQRYTGFPIAGKIVYIRAIDVSEGESDDPIANADEVCIDGETLLNTYETDEQ